MNGPARRQGEGSGLALVVLLVCAGAVFTDRLPAQDYLTLLTLLLGTRIGRRLPTSPPTPPPMLAEAHAPPAPSHPRAAAAPNLTNGQRSQSTTLLQVLARLCERWSDANVRHVWGRRQS